MCILHKSDTEKTLFCSICASTTDSGQPIRQLHYVYTIEPGAVYYYDRKKVKFTFTVLQSRSVKEYQVNLLHAQ